MERLILSMVRFSTALTLYGIEQVQTTMYVTQGGQDLFKVVDKFEITLNSLTEVLADRIDHSKQETLKSVGEMAEGVLQKSFESINLIDPREVLRATSDFVQRSSDAVTDWIVKPSATEDTEPQPAVEVLQ